MEYNFTTDWFSKFNSYWEKYLNDFKDKQNLHFLEIGCFQGKSTVWLLENILTHETSKITCIDTFEDYSECTPKESKDMLDLFMRNIAKFNSKVNVIKGSSHEELRKFEFKELFDLIYVDGDHKASSVLQDAVLSFPLLKKNGIMIFDDYLWRTDKLKDIDRPQPAIDCFLNIFGDHINIIFKDYQVFIQKI